jgi:four helix bundle protein
MATGLDNLAIYKEAKELEREVHSLLESFPTEEKYRKIDQLKRSSSSIVDNIAESYGRYGYQDKIQFLFLARGSAEEARSQLERAKDILKIENLDNLIEKFTIEIKKINGFIKFLRNQKQKNTK